MDNYLGYYEKISKNRQEQSKAPAKKAVGSCKGIIQESVLSYAPGR